jgi:CDP-paratose 2-epimerase
MSVAIITGSGGLIGSEAAQLAIEKGMDVVGIDNDMRAYFFGDAASTKWRIAQLQNKNRRYIHEFADIRNQTKIDKIFERYGADITVIIHAAAQPSHDWAAKEPITDYSINALGTLNLLEATRKFCPNAAFIYLSTNKVYGDTPNHLPLIERDTRWEIDNTHPFHTNGIDESMSIDQSTHSIFGASKASADLLVQEYGRYFGIPTACFRGGCLTGGGHSGAELHGFLSYLMKCTVTGKPYTVFGYKGKQVRDNIHSHDLVNALWTFSQAPRVAKVYNIGGSRFSNCSMLEAIDGCERVSGKRLNWSYAEDNRIGDHIWWISDIRAFQDDHPDYRLRYGIEDIYQDIFEAGISRWAVHVD